ncbi:MAG TPA: hypothetical protein VMH38_04715 [Thermoplasmata archaeon]|nr:hypothetical protein [Thermoplasmata archaeon]
MSPPGASRQPRVSEREVVATTAAYLQALGYRVYPNPDSNDYFDLVARKGNEVGLVEAKVSNSRAVLLQALRRRAWGDWVSVVLPSETAAARLAARTDGTRASPVGVWAAVDGTVRVVRAAAAWVAPGEEDPYEELRERFRTVLDRIDSGELPADVRWAGVVGAVRRASGGRGFKEWRLDEPSARDR